MENETSKFDSFELNLNSDSREYLYSAGKWAFFLGISGFVFSVLLLIVAIVIGIAFNSFSDLGLQSNPYGGLGGMFISGVYIIMAFVYGLFSYYLYLFGSKMKKAHTENNTTAMTQGIKSLMLFFKVWGILTIVGIALYVLFIIITIAGGASLFG